MRHFSAFAGSSGPKVSPFQLSSSGATRATRRVSEGEHLVGERDADVGRDAPQLALGVLQQRLVAELEIPLAEDASADRAPAAQLFLRNDGVAPPRARCGPRRLHARGDDGARIAHDVQHESLGKGGAEGLEEVQVARVLVADARLSVASRPCPEERRVDAHEVDLAVGLGRQQVGDGDAGTREIRVRLQLALDGCDGLGLEPSARAVGRDVAPEEVRLRRECNVGVRCEHALQEARSGAADAAHQDRTEEVRALRHRDGAGRRLSGGSDGDSSRAHEATCSARGSGAWRVPSTYSSCQSMKFTSEK